MTERKLASPGPVLALTGLALVAALSVPLVYLVVRAVQGGRAALSVLMDPTTVVLAARSIALTIGVTAGALLLGAPLAWVTSRTDLPFRRAWTVMFGLPLVVPSYLAAYSYIAAFGPSGALQRSIAFLGVERLPEIYGAAGAWLVLTLFTFPYVFLGVRSALAGIDPALEEAASTLGHSPRDILWKVIAPQLRPAAAMSALIVALYTIHDFGAVSLMRFDTFTRAIYLQYQGSFDRTAAATLSLALVAVTMMLVLLEVRARGAAGYHPTHGAVRRRATIHALGRLKVVWLLVSGVVALASIGIPFATVTFWAVTSGVEGGWDGVLGATLNSLRAATLGATVCVAAAIPLVLLASRHTGRVAKAAGAASYIGYSLPGVVVALSLVFFGARVVPIIYQTMVMLAFAYLVLFLPLAMGSIRASLIQLNPRVDEAARTLGAGRAGALFRVTIPQLRPGIVAAAAIVFLTVMKELPATLLLAPIGFKTLATQIWGATNSAAFGEAAIPAAVLIVASSLPLALLVFRGWTNEEMPPI